VSFAGCYNGGMTYSRTQYGHWNHLFFAFTLAALAGALAVRGVPPVLVLLLATAGTFLFCGLLVGSLTVYSEADSLVLRFGPLPLLGKRIRYADITAVEAGRTTILDGWGIHYMPGRGWTYNIWGFGCVKLTLGRKVIRIGTDEPEELAAFIREKLENPMLPYPSTDR
jgi:hypothetical protein